MASEASYAYIGPKFTKNAKKWSILASIWKSEAWKKIGGNANIEKSKYDISSNFQATWGYLGL